MSVPAVQTTDFSLVGNSEEEKRTVWNAVLPYVGPRGLATLSAVNKELRGLMEDYPRAADIRTKTQRLSQNQMRRLRNLCDAFDGNDYRKVERAQQSLKPQDYLVFPDLHKDRVKGLRACLATSIQEHAKLPETEYPRIHLEDMRRLGHVIEELCVALEQPIPLSMHDAAQRLVEKCVQELTLNTTHRIKQSISCGYIFDLRPIDRADEYKAVYTHLRYIRDPAEQAALEMRISDHAENERLNAATIVAWAPGTVPISERQDLINLWQQCPQDWWRQ